MRLRVKAGVLLPGRITRRLLWLSLVAAAVGSASLALFTALMMLGEATRQAEQRAQVAERDLTVSLTSFQPLYEAQRKMQLQAASGQVGMAMALDHNGTVIAASNLGLVGESILALASQSAAHADYHYLELCGPGRLGAACLDRPRSLFHGPLPWLGGEHLVRLTPIPLALEGGHAQVQRGTLITEVDLLPLLQQAGVLAVQAFIVGLVPLFFTCGALVLVVQRWVFPELLGLAQIDALSGVLNRRAFLEEVDYRLERAASAGQLAVVALIDVDHFKQINDSYGHAAGDEVIQATAGLLEHGVRRSDLVGRLGGDEFALLIEASSPQAYDLLERLRCRVDQRPILLADGQQVAITLSIGMAAQGGGSGNSSRELLAAADAALYVAKDQGRNCVVDLEGQPPKGWKVSTV